MSQYERNGASPWQDAANYALGRVPQFKHIGQVSLINAGVSRLEHYSWPEMTLHPLHTGFAPKQKPSKIKANIERTTPSPPEPMLKVIVKKVWSQHGRFLMALKHKQLSQHWSGG